MKRWAIWLAVIWLFAVAGAETVPDGVSYSAFRVTCDESLLEGWQTTIYLDATGFLLSAVSEDAEITVSVDESGTSQTASAFLRNHVNNVSRYGRVTGFSGPFSWENRWEVEGASIRYNYMYLNGSNADDEYQTEIYVAPFSANYFIIISVNAWGMNAAQRLLSFETEFLPTVNLETTRVSAPYLACLREIRFGGDGTPEAVIDFCTVEYDPEIYTIYVDNGDPTEYAFPIRGDALLYLPGAEGYGLTRVDAREAAVLQAGDGEETGKIYQILFDEDNEIVWMMHYNAI